jgi:UDP-N-acetylmuramoylalanine--D-glutamate ligase
LVAITGTNGKSTTTALIAHLLQSAGRDAQMGGNIGVPVLALEPFARGRVYVLEVSSYQIDLAPSLHATIGILLNVTQDHLDRHGSMENYAAIKARLPAAVEAGGTAVIGVDDDYTRAAAERIARAGRRVERVSVLGPLRDGYYAEGSRILRASDGKTHAVAELAGIGSLRGAHNAQNAACAVATCVALGLDLPAIQNGLVSFPGLAHRMQPIGRKGKVLFVNDSKATNADSAARALSSFQDIFWIAGGKPKTGGIASLAEFFPRIRKAYLIGEAAQDFAKTLNESLDGKVPCEIVATLERAVPLAAREAAASGLPEPVVLLSPACASFDQYRNFEVRGKAFTDLVLALPGVSSLSPHCGER